MPSSAIATYFAVNEGNAFRYVFLLRNTSSGAFDTYSLLIDAQYDVPFVPGVLQNMVALSAPQGWQLIPSTPQSGFLFGQTNFAGTTSQSGYILPGVVGVFSFDS